MHNIFKCNVAGLGYFLTGWIFIICGINLTPSSYQITSNHAWESCDCVVKLQKESGVKYLCIISVKTMELWDIFIYTNLHIYVICTRHYLLNHGNKTGAKHVCEEYMYMKNEVPLEQEC